MAWLRWSSGAAPPPPEPPPAPTTAGAGRFCQLSAGRFCQLSGEATVGLTAAALEAPLDRGHGPRARLRLAALHPVTAVALEPVHRPAGARRPSEHRQIDRPADRQTYRRNDGVQAARGAPLSGERYLKWGGGPRSTAVVPPVGSGPRKQLVITRGLRREGGIEGS
eukprot:COSAG01_NODE_1876_length_8997_cov_11.629355_4_plen_166_part_00